MKLPRRKFLQLAGGAAALPALPGIARAQAYPTRPITLIAPFPAGGPVDTIARILGEHLQGTLGQPCIIEDVAGAAGSIGVGRVARAAPDGYTLSVAMEHPCRQCRHLQASLRHAHRLPADRAAVKQSGADCRTQGSAGQ
jgi:hypothetical protein